MPITNYIQQRQNRESQEFDKADLILAKMFSKLFLYFMLIFILSFDFKTFNFCYLISFSRWVKFPPPQKQISRVGSKLKFYE